MIHDVFEDVVSKIFGSSPMIGTSSVWANDTTMPVNARTAMTDPGRLMGGVTADAGGAGRDVRAASVDVPTSVHDASVDEVSVNGVGGA